MPKKRRKDVWESALDDPLFYVPLIGPILHAVKVLVEVDEEDWEDEWDEPE